MPSFYTRVNLMLSFVLIIILTSIYPMYATDETTNTLHNLLAKAKENDGIIEGNPLLYPECANALLDRHKSSLEYLNKSAIPIPWFWSRESIDAVSKNIALTRRTKYTFTNSGQQSIPRNVVMSYDYAVKMARLIPNNILSWYLQLGEQINTDILQPIHFAHNDGFEDNKHDNNTCFYHIEKSGSSSIAGMMHEYNFNTSYTSENVLYHCQCGFTFVRDPISRFVSGYYTINKLIYWFHHHLERIGKKSQSMDAVPKRFSFWNITGEPQRMIEFVNNIYDYSYEFTKITPLEHMMTQSGLLGVASVDIHYIGDVSKLMSHLEVIKNKCAVKTNNKFLLENDLVEKHIMTNFGTKWFDELRPWYTDMLSLDDYVKGDLDPAYLAIADNYDLYYKIVEFYKQDYVCFGFQHDWLKFRETIYEKLYQTMLRKKKKRLNDTHVLIRNG